MHVMGGFCCDFGNVYVNYFSFQGRLFSLGLRHIWGKKRKAITF